MGDTPQIIESERLENKMKQTRPGLMALFIIICMFFIQPVQAENKTGQSENWAVITSDGFEDGFGNWNRGGDDCSVASKAQYANRGNKSIQLRGNTDKSLINTSALDLSSSDRVKIDFSYYTGNIDRINEGFQLQISTDNGKTFSLVEKWNSCVEFVKDQRYNEELIIDGPFTEKTIFQFRCHTSGDMDYVYIDDVVVSVYNENALPVNPNLSANNSGELVVKAINVGGKAYTASDGTRYSADKHYTDGDVWTVAADIAGAEDSQLYKSQRFQSSEFSYSIPLSNGNYTVELKMAELYYASSDSSVFDINIEGSTVIEKLDVFEESKRYVAHDEAVNVTVTDGELNISFIPSVGEAFISAFKVIANDSDGDQISDPDEIKIYGTNPNQADTDSDGIVDSAELDYWKEQWNTDSDNDGLYNLIDPDSDNDGNNDIKEYELVINSVRSHYNGEKMEFSQPDGSILEVLLFGDAYFMRAESPDGYTLIPDTSTGWICYAKLSEPEARLISSGIPYSSNDFELSSLSSKTRMLSDSSIIKKLNYPHDQIQEIRNNSLEKQSSPLEMPLNMPAPVIGTINQLAILVDFPDRVANVSTNEIYNSYNASSYGDKRGSIKSWATTISNNMVTLHTYVIGYYTAKYNTDHYKRGTTHDYSAADELKAELLPWADDNFDFASLTSDGGRVRSFNILYTGDTISNGWANSLWPHASWYNYQTDDGVKTGSYFMSNIGSNQPLNLSTTRHELGHNVFKWPDTYDYQSDSYSGGGFAMETDLPCAPFRAIHEWIDVVDINNLNQSHDLPDNANTALKYTNPLNANEYFMIEYVRKTGWRSNARDEGILIWHVDENGDNSWQDMTTTRHYRHSVEQADGLFELEKHIKNGSDGDLFHAGFKTTFDNSSTPNSNWWDGTLSGLKVSNIGNKGGSTMRVTIGSGSNTEYSLIVNSGSGDGSYISGARVTITADPAPSGRIFDRWVTNSGNPLIDNTTATPTNLTMPASAATITATYKDIPKYTLTVNSGSGDGSYISGTMVTITADPAPSGRIFDRWVTNLGNPLIDDTTASATTLIMPAGTVTITATFKDLPKYTLTVYSGSGDGSYISGARATTTADPAPSGMMFDRWVTNFGNPSIDNTTASGTILTMSASAATITATYKDIPPPEYALTVNNGSGDGSYISGDRMTIAASPAPANKVFHLWVVNSGSPSIRDKMKPSTTLTMDSGPAEITAMYKNKSSDINDDFDDGSDSGGGCFIGSMF